LFLEGAHAVEVLVASLGCGSPSESSLAHDLKPCRAGMTRAAD
jgi:hypothetical protein